MIQPLKTFIAIELNYPVFLVSNPHRSLTNTDVLLMDGIARPLVSGDIQVPQLDPFCPICLVGFHGRTVAPVVVKTQCCGKHFDLDCILTYFVDHPIGARRCAMCRQNPMPVVNLNSGESHPDTFFPDQTFYRACFERNLDQVNMSLEEGVNVNVHNITHDHFTPLMMASLGGHKTVVECLISAGANLN
ncbi:ankyrin repeat domain-containing protein, partial [Endozoicomonas sp. SESOKO2]